MHLNHIHLPSLTHYAHAAALQDRFVRALLNYKNFTSTTSSTSTSTFSSATSKSASTSPIPPEPQAQQHKTSLKQPNPTILTFQLHPVYTTGRRDLDALDAAQVERLTSPFKPSRPARARFQSSSDRHAASPTNHATLHAALRGGQTTYHGPGQLTAFAIIDLKRHGLSPREFVHDVLEESVIGTLSEFGVRADRTGNPGVWTGVSEKFGLGKVGGMRGGEARGVRLREGRVEDHQRTEEQEQEEEEEQEQEEQVKKICALGIHLRRFVTSHGIGLNVEHEPIEWLSRVVACGLEGVGASCIEDEMRSQGFVGGHGLIRDCKGGGAGGAGGEARRKVSVEEVARVFVRRFAGCLGGRGGERVKGIAEVGEGDIKSFREMSLV